MKAQPSVVAGFNVYGADPAHKTWQGTSCLWWKKNHEWFSFFSFLPDLLCGNGEDTQAW